MTDKKMERENLGVPHNLENSISFSADYLLLDEALKEIWKQFTLLIEEIDCFEARPPEDFESDRLKMFEHMSQLNPDLSSENIWNFVDGQFSILIDPEKQFRLRFSTPLMTLFATTTLVSHALCEGVVNAILAYGLVATGREDIFSKIEKMSLKEKWLKGPKKFVPTYELDLASPLFETLQHLSSQRNTFTHYKTTISSNGNVILAGIRPLRTVFKENISWMKRYFSLPYDLSLHALMQLKGIVPPILLGNGLVERAEQHKIHFTP